MYFQHVKKVYQWIFIVLPLISFSQIEEDTIHLANWSYEKARKGVLPIGSEERIKHFMNDSLKRLPEDQRLKLANLYVSFKIDLDSDGHFKEMFFVMPKRQQQFGYILHMISSIVADLKSFQTVYFDEKFNRMSIETFSLKLDFDSSGFVSNCKY